MKRFALLLLAAALSGCATFDRNEIASVRGRGVPPRIVEKLDRGLALTPTDVIDLHRYRVPDPWVVRQLEDHDVDSLVTRRDVLAMRKAGVSAQVIDATLSASDRFRGGPRYPMYASSSPYPYGTGPWAFDDGWGGYGPYPYDYGYGFGGSVIIPIHGGGGHWHHHHR